MPNQTAIDRRPTRHRIHTLTRELMPDRRGPQPGCSRRNSTIRRLDLRPASDADTTTASSTHPPNPPTRRSHTGPTTHAPSDASPRTGGQHRSPSPHRSTPRAPPDSAAPRHPAPQAPTTPSTLETTDHQPPPRRLTHDRQTQSVKQLPEPVSPSYRNRVPKLSPTYRSHSVKHEPDFTQLRQRRPGPLITAGSVTTA